MRLLITGATGFIGTHCMSILENKDFEIHAISSQIKYFGLKSKTVKWHHMNLLNYHDINKLILKIKPTHLLHLSWHLAPGDYASSMDNYYWTQASLEILYRFHDCGGKRVVIAGSSFEYDWNYGYCSEYITPQKPSTFYGVCKSALKDLLAGYSEITGLSSAWPRIFFLYGPNEHSKRLVPSVICSLLKGQPALCSHGNQIRDYLYVKDVAGAIVSLLLSNVTGTINIGSGDPVYLKNIILKIGEKIGRTELVKLGAIPSRSNDTRIVIADTTRLNNELGWSPKYNMDQGLDETIEWFKYQMNN